VESSVPERHGAVALHPEEGHRNDPSNLSYKDRLRELEMFIMENGRL